MVSQVKVNEDVLQWAVDYSGKSHDFFRKRYPKFDRWLSGSAFPTLKQVKTFADHARLPVGVLFQSSPPIMEPVSSYFRKLPTVSSEYVEVSPVLRETVYSMQAIQEWMSEMRQSYGDDVLEYVGSVAHGDETELYRQLNVYLDVVWPPRQLAVNGFDYLRTALENVGVIVMRNSILGANTHVKLSIDEFRGFSLTDPYAPLIFVNGNDSKAAQIFTLIHEFCHLLLGENHLQSGDSESFSSDESIEKLCNRVTAMYLMPDSIAIPQPSRVADFELLAELARKLRVSELALAIKWKEHDLVNDDFTEKVRERTRENLRLLEAKRAMGGGGRGNFYANVLSKISPTFLRELMVSTKEGATLYKEAYSLLGFKGKTFEEISKRVLGN